MIKGDRILNVGTPPGGGVSIIANDPVASGGGGDSIPITTGLELFVNPDVDVYSDAGTTLAVDGDNIRQVNDQSSNSIILSQTTASNQFTYKEAGLGTGNASFFKDSQWEWLQLGSAISFTNSESFVVYSVVDRADATSRLIPIGRDTGSSRDRIVEQNGLVYWQDNNSNWVFVSQTSPTTVTLRTYVVDRTNNLCRLYENGTETDTASAAGLTGSFTFNRLHNHDPNSGPMQGHFGYTLIYRGLHSAADVTSMWNWINAKYSIV
jgi:hypothetical protein